MLTHPGLEFRGGQYPDPISRIGGFSGIKPENFAGVLESRIHYYFAGDGWLAFANDEDQPFSEWTGEGIQPIHDVIGVSSEIGCQFVGLICPQFDQELKKNESKFENGI